MRILFLGDIVGRPGVDLIRTWLGVVREREGVDFVIANAENAADGSGLGSKQFRVLRQAGVDLVTLGDHVYKKREIIATLEKEQAICRPANFPEGTPGREFALGAARDGTRVAVFSLLGRTFMRPAECPYRAADRVLASLAGQADCVVVDMHAEATADKYLMGHYLKGRVAAVLGTHTHVPTADEQILPGGTAFICDVGMTGPYDSILGRRVDRVLSTAVSFVPSSFDVALGDVRLAGALVEVQSETGRATAIRRVMLGESTLLGWLPAPKGDGLSQSAVPSS
jgi:metallophosphoesterase (TIGR00282 family)